MFSGPFVKAEEGKDGKLSVVYYDAVGNRMIRYHNHAGKIGSHAWRNNNPGNLSWGSGEHARACGCIGKAKGRPVFPDYETGEQAMRLLLKKNFYQIRTLNNLPRKYTGVKDGEPDTQEVIDYRKTIKFFTNFDMDRRVDSLNSEEFEKLLDTMKKHEGWQVGHEEPLPLLSIIGVRVNRKKVISEYLIQGRSNSDWLSKHEAISLAEARLVGAIVVHGRASTYLRAKHGTPSFRTMLS